MPCQPGFLCSPDNKCSPAGDLITLFPTQMKDPHIYNSEIPLHRILRETSPPSDEDGELNITFAISTIYSIINMQVQRQF